MNHELLESITDLTYAQARFFSRPSPFHLQRQFMTLQDRIITLLTQFPARLPPPPPTPARQLDIPINLIQMLFGSNATVGLGQGQNQFWEAVVVGLTPEQFATGTRDYSNPPDVAQQDQCCICQESIATEASIETMCPGPDLGDGVTSINHHAFHRRCAQSWFAISTKCPVCRADLRTLTPTTTNVGANVPGGEPDPAPSSGVHSNV